MPKIPEGAKKPTDRAAKAEAKGEDITLTFEGAKYVIPRDRADNVELFELIEDDKAFSAARAFLGVEQWQAFKDSIRLPDGRVPGEPTERFLNALMVAIGGGSEDSPNS
jgi:hypothetical protein